MLAARGYRDTLAALNVMIYVKRYAQKTHVIKHVIYQFVPFFTFSDRSNYTLAKQNDIKPVTEPAGWLAPIINAGDLRYK